MIIDKRPKGMSVKSATELLKTVFTGDTAVFKKLKVDITDDGDHYTVVVKRSKNAPWDSTWLKPLNNLFAIKYNNGWKHEISKTDNSKQTEEILPSNMFEEFQNAAVKGLTEEIEAKQQDTEAYKPTVIPDTVKKHSKSRKTELIQAEPEETDTGSDTVDSNAEELGNLKIVDGIIRPSPTTILEPLNPEEQDLLKKKWYDPDDPRLKPYIESGKYNEYQIEELGRGLRAGVDITQYDDPSLSYHSMMASRLWLIRHQS